ncbi:MerR family transcriptional regulator [Agromyces luteolus]|uniref:MerR family transcriptional regulator n=1 Tax=Agromyces luteolus TaxID=88373 RepID=A0A7C9LSD9_9MICO|nr:MerR family transcriptional regulator [Agromyces luteolus]MUN06696.1 MerR family transcriptional regulator [Agromyces luteolus]GLK27789.1 MerR family transcriptional regulator [Agromyces luteolus]
MSEGAAARRPSHAPPLLGIGQVLARLQPEFPELTPSKLRFLEEQGLVTPARTAAGYRKFSPADIERITVVLSMQRDHYLPLKVIRAHLEEIDAGRTPALPGVVDATAFRATAARYSREDLIRETGAGAALLDDAISASLIRPAEVYGQETKDLLTALAALRASGIEPRHLRGLRAAAERQTELVERAIAPERRSDPAGRARSAERARELGDRLAVVHAAVIRDLLDRRSH